MLILQRRGHDSPCMQKGQNFLWVIQCLRYHVKISKLSAESQNQVKVSVTTEAA